MRFSSLNGREITIVKIIQPSTLLLLSLLTEDFYSFELFTFYCLNFSAFQSADNVGTYSSAPGLII